MLIACVILWIGTLVLVRCCFVIPIFRFKKEKTEVDRESRNKTVINAFIFLGSGGHTGEMLRLMDNYGNLLRNKANVIHVGYSDVNSLKKFKGKYIGNEQWRGVNFKYYEFRKARNVGSGFLVSLYSIFKTLVSSLKMVVSIKFQMGQTGNITLLNGPGTCCIITLWLKIIEFFTFKSSRVIYVESLARTNKLSLTGKIVYPFVDEFVVQWPDLLNEYPRARYYGILV